MALVSITTSSFLALLVVSVTIQTTICHSDKATDHSDFEQKILLGDSEDGYFKLDKDGKAEILRTLAKKMDKDNNGTISEEELLEWIRRNHVQQIIKKSKTNFITTDENRNGLVTFEEYENSQYNYPDVPKTYKDTSLYRHEMRRFKFADRDEDGNLTLKEYIYFLNPEEGKHMIPCIAEETIDNMDRDGDGLISVKDYIGERILDMDGDEFVRTVKEFKDELDKNRDGVLDKEEVIQWIASGHRTTAQTETKHLLEHGDLDKDGQLSYDEVVAMGTMLETSKATQYGDILDKLEPTKDEL